MSRNKKQDSVRRVWIIAIATILIASGYVMINIDKFRPAIVEKGDKVHIKYVVRLDNGSLVDTNYVDIAQSEGMTRYKTKPLVIEAGGKDSIKAISEGVIGMKVGETKELTAFPEQAYGTYDPDKVLKTPIETYTKRFKAIPRYVDLNTTVFRAAFMTQPEEGKIVKSDVAPWSYEVVSVNNGSVRVKARIKNGDVYFLPRMPWQSTVVSVNEDNVTFRHDPPEGLKIKTIVGEAAVTPLDDEIRIDLTADVGDKVKIDGKEVSVTSKDDTFLYSDNNHPLSGKTLKIKIEVVDVEKQGR